jgi:hypothetical protein
MTLGNMHANGVRTLAALDNQAQMATQSAKCQAQD